MYEREIKFITDFNLNMVKKLGSFFTIENLVNSKIHPALIQYIDAELEYLIYLDRQRLLHKSLFDYSGKEISSHLTAISAIIKKNKMLPYEEIKRLIQHAVTFNVNYLSRPQWTLRKFVYDNEESRSGEEIRLFLGYTYYYEYYRQYIEKYVEKKNILSLSLADFNERLRILSRELMKTHSAMILSDAMQSIADFFNIGETQKTKLPVGIVETFLKDLSLNELVLKVKRFLSTDPKLRFEVDDYMNAFFTDLPSGTVTADQEDEEQFITPGAESTESKEKSVTKIAETPPVTEIPQTPLLLTPELTLDDLFKEHPPVTVANNETEAVEEKQDIPQTVLDSEKVTPGEFVRNVTSELEAIKDDYENEKRNISAQSVVNEIREAITQINDQKSLSSNNSVTEETGIASEAKTAEPKTLQQAADSFSKAQQQQEETTQSSAEHQQDDVTELQLNLTSIIEGYGSIEFHEETDEISEDDKSSDNVIPKISFSGERVSKPDVTFDEVEKEIQQSIESDSTAISASDAGTVNNTTLSMEILEDSSELTSPQFTIASMEEDLTQEEAGDEKVSNAQLYDAKEQNSENLRSAQVKNVPAKESEQQALESEQELKSEEILSKLESNLHPPQRNEKITAALADTLTDSFENETELFEYFTTKETMRIISAIFGNDSVDFMNTIEKIAQCNSIVEAKEILKAVFHSYHINPLTSKEAIILEARVSTYFEEKR